MKRKSIKLFSICAALIFVLLTSGCVGPTVRTYRGDKLQKSEVAVIKGWYYFTAFGYDCISIYRIDGSSPKVRNVEVLPGWHELEIMWYSFSFVVPLGLPARYAEVKLNCEAGHEYIIMAQFKGIVPEGVKIIDVTTGAIILSQPWQNWYKQKTHHLYLLPNMANPNNLQVAAREVELGIYDSDIETKYLDTILTVNKGYWGGDRPNHPAFLEQTHALSCGTFGP